MTPEPGSAAPAGGQELSDLSALKALAQPRRQQILQHLTLHGPATSAMLARDLGLNTGATSYHLRELARYGFAEESSTQGRSVGGRERWWRAVPGDRRFPPRSRQNPETRLVMDELNHLSYAADLELFEQLQRQGQDRGSGPTPSPTRAARSGSRCPNFARSSRSSSPSSTATRAPTARPRTAHAPS